MQEDGVDDAEDGGVGADAECEREDGDDGEGRIFAKRAEGEADVLAEDCRRRLRWDADRVRFVGSAAGCRVRGGRASEADLEIGAARCVIARGHLEMGFEFGVEVGAIAVANSFIDLRPRSCG